MNPRWCLFFCLLFVSTALSAQDHYLRLTREGEEFMKQQQYEEAEFKYRAAWHQAGDDEIRKEEAERAIQQAREGYLNLTIALQKKNLGLQDSIIRQREEAARRQRILSNALKTAFESQDKIAQDSFLIGLQLADQARDSLISIDEEDSFVNRTFADAAYNYYKKTVDTDISTCKGVGISRTRPQAVYYGVDSKLALIDCSAQLVLSPSYLTDHRNYITYVAYAEDGRHIVSCSQDGTARVYNSDGQLLHVLQGHEDAVVYAVFARDATAVLTGSRDGTARLWQLTELQPPSTVLAANAHVRDAAFISDGRLLTRSVDHKARLWDSDQTELKQMEHPPWIRVATFSPESNYILTAGFDDTPKLWRNDGSHAADLVGHQGAVLSAVFSEDGQRILTTSSDGTAIIWDLMGSAIATLPGHPQPVIYGAFDTQRQHVLTLANNSDQVWVWDANDGSPIATLDHHTDKVNTAVFAPDGNSILTASADRTAKLWNLQGGLLMNMDRFDAPLADARFLPALEGVILLFTTDGQIRACYTPEEAMKRFR